VGTRREFCALIYIEGFLEQKLSNYFENLRFFLCQSGPFGVTSGAIWCVWESSWYPLPLGVLYRAATAHGNVAVQGLLDFFERSPLGFRHEVIGEEPCRNGEECK
jgi:hypothetical protein